MFHDSESSVYLLHNQETGQTYVGSTGNNDYRRQQHLLQLKNGTHPNYKLQAAFNQNPNFDFVSVPMEEREAAYDLEQAILNEYYRTPGFLNLSHDARAGAHSWTESSREKLRQAHLGRKHTEETKAKMSASRMGRTFSEESIEKMRNKPITPEFREKMSGILKGNQRGLGTKHSAESIRRRVEKQGNPVTVNGVEYVSRGEAARALGVTVTTVTARINSGKFPTWQSVE